MEITISDRDDYMQIRVRKMREGRVLRLDFQTAMAGDIPEYLISWRGGTTTIASSDIKFDSFIEGAPTFIKGDKP
jgi:hypothetical protein